MSFFTEFHKMIELEVNDSKISFYHSIVTILRVVDYPQSLISMVNPFVLGYDYH
jgi:hypothetical protein